MSVTHQSTPRHSRIVAKHGSLSSSVIQDKQSCRILPRLPPTARNEMSRSLFVQLTKYVEYADVTCAHQPLYAILTTGRVQDAISARLCQPEMRCAGVCSIGRVCGCDGLCSIGVA